MIERIGIDVHRYPKGYVKPARWIKSLFKIKQRSIPRYLWVCPQFCVNTAGQCKIEQKYFKAGAAPAAAALPTK